jgi:Zn-dependent alcohol dehydrogenase
MPDVAEQTRVARDSATRWLGLAAFTAFGVAAWKVGVWVNHWSMAERFLHARAGGGPEGGDWWAAADLMSSGNHELVVGLGWLGVTAVLVAGAVVARRRAAAR